jgi:hypothetical protein
MAQVYRIMLLCPETRQEVDTGMRTSGREVLSSDIYREGTAKCPHCGRFHVFEGNAYLQIESDSSADSLWRPNP